MNDLSLKVKDYQLMETKESDERLLEYIQDVREGRISTIREKYANDEKLMTRCDTVDKAIQGQINILMDLLIIAQYEARAFRNLFNGLIQQSNEEPGSSNYRVAANKISIARQQLHQIDKDKQAMGDDFVEYNKKGSK